MFCFIIARTTRDSRQRFTPGARHQTRACKVVVYGRPIVGALYSLGNAVLLLNTPVPCYTCNTVSHVHTLPLCMIQPMNGVRELHDNADDKCALGPIHSSISVIPRRVRQFSQVFTPRTNTKNYEFKIFAADDARPMQRAHYLGSG